MTNQFVHAHATNTAGLLSIFAYYLNCFTIYGFWTRCASEFDFKFIFMHVNHNFSWLKHSAQTDRMWSFLPVVLSAIELSKTAHQFLQIAYWNCHISSHMSNCFVLVNMSFVIWLTWLCRIENSIRQECSAVKVETHHTGCQKRDDSDLKVCYYLSSINTITRFAEIEWL